MHLANRACKYLIANIGIYIVTYKFSFEVATILYVVFFGGGLTFLYFVFGNDENKDIFLKI